MITIGKNGSVLMPGKFHRLLNKQCADHLKDFNIQQLKEHRLYEQKRSNG